MNAAEPFDLPRGVVMPVNRVDVTLEPRPHPVEVEQIGCIEANWAAELAVNPALFDGEIALLSSLCLRDGDLVGRCHIARYATFLYWRRTRVPGAEHAFAHAALVSADGALVAIRMGPQTVNPGAVYFAAGSFEPPDFVAGQVDLHLNMRREVLEETGIDLADADREATCHFISENGATAIFRRYRLGRPAAAIAEGVTRFVAREQHPEIEGPVIIRDPLRLPEGIMPHMSAFVRWHFGAA